MEVRNITGSWQRSKNENLKLSSHSLRNGALEIYTGAEKVSAGLEKIHGGKPLSSPHTSFLCSLTRDLLCKICLERIFPLEFLPSGWKLFARMARSVPGGAEYAGCSCLPSTPIQIPSHLLVTLLPREHSDRFPTSGL